MIYTFEHPRIRKCENCPIFQRYTCIDGECRASGLFVSGIDITKERPFWCPLIEEKTMRTIKKKGAKRA
ncbi:MAG: hypothetical protein Q4A78_12015 [Peptostreptococcaceae bacterium]|nr:hypothetical protein [Peptostreptococcaceae bacterium]